MKNNLIIFVIFLFTNFGDLRGYDEFVTVWAPKYTQNKEPYGIFFFSSNFPDNVKLAAEFRRSNVTSPVVNDRHQRIVYPNTRHLGKVKSADLSVTLHRKQLGQDMCMTKSLKILPEIRKLFTFIQLDKPIYKPGDEIKVRAIVVDRNMQPYHLNNINITLYGPNNMAIYQTGYMTDGSLGVVEARYNLSDFAILGDWKVNVVADKHYEWEVSKKFTVQKYVLPLFEVVLHASDQHVLRESTLTLHFNGRYSFGENVAGRAELVIKRLDTDQILKEQTFENVFEVKKVSLGVESDLSVRVPSDQDEVRLEATVTIEEHESQLRFNKTIPIYVHGDDKYKMIVFHPEKYLPGVPFIVKVFVRDWKNNPVKEHYEKVEFAYMYRQKNGNTGTVTIPKYLEDSAATFEIIPEDFAEFRIEAIFVSSKKYEKTIQQGAVNVAINALVVEHLPVSPKLYENVTFFVNSDREMDEVLVAVMTLQGNLESKKVDCNYEKLCKFTLQVTEKMMPHSQVAVYHVVDKMHIFQGISNITTNELGSSKLTLKMSTSKTSTKKLVKFDFEAAKGSKIYLLGYDKRLTYLREGNEVTRENVKESFADYDGTNYVMVFDTSDSNEWHSCTPKELLRVESGTQQLTQQAGETIYSIDDDFGDFQEPNDEPFGTRSIVSEEEEDELINLRDFFPETWIFETISLGKSESAISKDFIVPDSMTTWMISAFSAKKGSRLAIAPTQELVVKNEFFIKLNLPYSIRYMEILRLDILVYNYIEARRELNVKVNVENLVKKGQNMREFEFIEYNDGDDCNPVGNTNARLSKEVKVPPMSVRRVSFYIRNNPQDKEFHKTILKKILFKVIAKGKTSTGEEYVDAIGKRLLVEPVGVKDYKAVSRDLKLRGGSHSHSDFYGDVHEEDLSNSRKYPRINVMINGDFLTNHMKLDSKFDFYPWNCLEQRTSKLKGNIEFFRYRQAMQVNASRHQFFDYYQKILNENMNSVWSYRSSSGYRAYFTEAFTSMLELRAVSEDDRNRGILETELNNLKSWQTADGNFPISSFPGGHSGGSTGIYYDTAYALIPFLKYQNYKNNTNLYADVVTKAFNFMNDNRNSLSVSYEGMSIAAYAYALDGNKETAKKFLTNIEKAKILSGTNQKCFKLNRSDSSCNLRHTVYAALAHITIGSVKEAWSIVGWILKSYNLNYVYSNTYDHAIATEAIAKVALQLKQPQTNLTVSVTNEHGYSREIKITKSDSDEPRENEIPEYSRNVTYTVSGTGYCSLTTIFETKIYTNQVSSWFDIKAVKASNVAGGKLIKVCAKSNQTASLMNVIYEVEIPSGYVYERVENLAQISNVLKYVEPKRKNTMVQLYYDDFTSDQEHCANIRLKKLFEVKNLQAAGVKVYDYGDKSSVTVKFYGSGKC